VEAELPILTYDQGSPAVHADLVAMPIARVAVPLGASAWSLGLDGRYLDLAYREADAAATLHARREAWLAATAWRRFGLGAVTLDGGVGYFARWQTDTASVLWHGPQLRAALDLPVIDGSGWAVRVGGGVMPYLFGGSGYTWGHDLAVAFEVPLGTFALDLGYRRFGLGGEVFQGPYVSLGGPR
jgi:hypothetical protein